MKRYFVRLSYDGTNYAGWQIQPNAHTVQEELQSNLTKLNSGSPIKIMGCGRTDTGVHAKNFFMHMDFPEIKDLQHFAYKLNIMLPEDIVVHEITEMHNDAHTRFDAIERTYHYHIHGSKSPFNRHYSLEYTGKLDVDKMNKAAQCLMNYDDFEAFSKVKTAVKSFVCDVREAKWEKTDEGFVFIISADRFLRNMVRAVVGTLLEVGAGNLSIDGFKGIILSKDRNKAGRSVPPHGLCLVNVKYRDTF